MSHKEYQRKSTHMTDTSANTHRPTLLFVDDEPDFLSSLEDYFSTFAEVYTAADTTTALTIVETYKPDVIICDLRLKEAMNGIEFLEKTIAISPDSERILITAFGDIHSMINAINRARLSYYLNKPVDFHQLKMAVLQLSEITHLRHQNNNLLDTLRSTNTELAETVEIRNEELRQAYSHLQELQKTREQMVRTAVHDLKTPIGNLELVLNELERGTYNDEDFKELVSIARMSSGIMRTLVEDMLTVAVMSQPQYSLNEDVFNLSEFFEIAIEPFYTTAQNKNIQLTMNWGDNLPDVYADPNQLRQLTLNLVSNAIKYTPQGGTVTVHAQYNDGVLLFSVTDTGLGMTSDDIANAFQEFRRLSARPTGNESSTGLGLFIVKKVVDMYDGTVNIQSDGQGKGTTFTVTLKLKQAIEE